MRSVLRFKENLIPVRGLVFSGPLSPLLLQHLCCYSVAATQWQNERVPIKCSNLLYEFTTYCYSRDLPRAMQALNSLQKHKIWADAVTYSELIKCCLARGAVEQGKRVHQHVFSNGYEPKTFLVNTLMNMYVKFKMLDEAQDLFDQMSDRNVVSWTTMIAAYSSAKINNKALEFLILMRRDGVRPNMFTYSSVLRACDDLSNLRQLHCSILKVGLESDVFVRSALIDVYSKMGQLECAMCTFNEMVTGDLVVWNSIIGGFAQNSDGDEALMLFKRMKRVGFSADQSTLTSVLRACTSLALLELGRQVHVHLVKFQRDLILDNALLDMYCKCGNLEDAHQIFTQMIEKDVISWSTMIIGYAQNGFSRKALELFNEMKVSGIKPNYITVLGVLFACSHAGLVEDGQYYFHSMKKLFGIDPGREHYGCMVDLLGRSGKLDEAVKLIREMECEPDAVTWRTLLGACRVHRNMDLAEYAAKQIIKLDPSDAGTYILLSNIYARTQKWEDVEDLRRSMKERGVKKEPGCSWVEVNKQIHAFIMGDNSHPQIKEINKELNQIIWKLKEAGYVPDTNFVLQDLEDEQMEDSLLYHSEKIAVAFGVMSLSREKTIRIRKNLRICGDCHLFAKLLAQIERRSIVIRDPIRLVTFAEIVAMMKVLCYSDSPKLLLHLCRILQKALLWENLMRTHRYFEESEQHRMKHNVLVHEAAVGFIRVYSLLNLHLHWQLRVSRLAIRITARVTDILKIANVEAELTSHSYQRKDRLEHILYVTGICTDS